MAGKKTGKRLLTWVLVLVMALSLLPLNALAEEGDPTTDGGAAATDDKLHFTKEATLGQQPDEIIVHMEAWATGEVTTNTSTEALDIALVLDVSGSMNEDFIQEESKFDPVYNLDSEKTYYVKDYYYREVTWCEKCEAWTNGCWVGPLSGYHYEGTEYEPKASADDSNSDHEQFYEYSYTPQKSKLDALKEAVNSFIDDVATKSPNSQISIVKFAGDKSDSVGNDTYGSYNYTQIVTKLTKVNESGAAELKDAVNALNYGGATAADYGMEKAKEALRDADTSHKKVVVLFTDGEPNHQNGFDYSVAADTVNTAKELKKDTTIYTIGVFREQDNDVDLYMSSTSSNYPNASATTSDEEPYWSVTGGDDKIGDYYMKVTDAADLLNAFEKISSEVTPGTALGSTAVLTDVIAPNCSLVVPAETSGITAYTVDKTADGWSTTQTPLEGNAVTVIGQKVQVTGFDYSANCVTATPKPNTTNDYGKKLVVEFKVQNNNYGGTQPTNSDAFISDGNSTRVKEADRPRPEVAAPVKLPEQVAAYADSKVYDGKGYDITANIADLVSGLVPVDSKNNEYINLSYEIKDSNGNVVDMYTIPAGQTTGTWADGKSDIKTPADVGNYTYTVTVTGTDSSLLTNSARQSYTAKFNITARPLEITANSASKDYDGQKLTLTAKDYALTNNTSLAVGDTIESVTVSGEVGPNAGSRESTVSNAVIKRGDTDVTTNYAITYKPGMLTITSTGTVTVTFKIEGGTWDGQNDTADKSYTIELIDRKCKLTGIAIPEGKPDTSHEEPGTWNNNANIPGDPSSTTELTKDTVFTLTFKEKNTEPPVEDKYSLTINYVGPDDGVFKAPPKYYATELADGAPYNVSSPTIPGYTPDQKIVSGKINAENVTVTVTYTKEIKPDTVLDVLNQYVLKQYVLKQFKSTYGDTTATFTADATVKEIVPVINSLESQIATQEFRPVGTYTGTVTLSAGTSDLFDFSGMNASLKKNAWYEVTVTERDTKLPYVTYDTAPHTFSFTTDEYGQVKNVQGVTITNTYYKRTYRPSTPSKPTLNTGDHYAYVMGYPDGTVRPNGSITRAEVSAILFRLLSDKTRDEYFTTESSFTDVKAGAWYNNSIATLEKAGVIVDTAKGDAFRPNEAITRAELAAMLAQFSDAKPVKGVKFSDVSAEHWAYEAIAIAAKMGWIEGYPDGTFRPDATITRAEMMTLVNRALERVPSDEDHLLSKRVMLTFPDCKSGDWFYIAVQEATNSHTYERAATEKNGDEQWTALRANRDWTLLEK